MSIKQRIIFSLSFILFAAFLCRVQAQGTSVAKKTVPYYIDINKSNRSTVYDVQPDALSFQYYDAYGKAEVVSLNIYDWKRALITKLSLDKTFGLNHFNIKLNEISPAMAIGNTYSCELIDEHNKKYEVQIKLVSPPVKPNPEADIFVNPIRVDCKNLTGSLVEFYGQISGGKAPYSTDWFVLNSGMSDFLYQPTSEEVVKAGKSMVIEVDKTPDYYVLFRVKDSCGGVQQKMVHIVCEDETNKINTVFVEPITLPSTATSKTR